MNQDLSSHLNALEEEVMKPTTTTVEELSNFSKEINAAAGEAVQAIYLSKEKDVGKIGIAMLTLKGLIEKYTGSKSTSYLAKKVLPFYNYIREHAMALYAIEMNTIALNIRNYSKILSGLNQAAAELPKMYAMI